MKKITIGGIGSVLLGDDGVGPYVIRLLENGYSFADGVTIADLGTPGLDLVAHLSDVNALVLIDSVANGELPGTVTLYRKDDIVKHSPGVRMDPHSPTLLESLLIADLAGQGPEEILLIGITGEQYEVGCDLSEAVRQAAALAVQQVLAELDRLESTYHSTCESPALQAWWQAPAHA